MIGANPGATRIEFFNGLIDRVRISKAARYDKDFTPQLRFEPDKDTLALYYFDEGSGDSLNDSSGNNHHGKIVGAKWVKVDGAAITASVPDREAAEWVLSVGGTVSVSVSGSNARTIESEIKEAAKLPTGAFRLTKFTVPESVTTEAEKLALFGKSTMLREIDLGRIPLTDDGLKALAPLKRLTIFSSSAFGVNLKLSDEGFRVFESFPELSFLAMSNFIPSNQQADSVAKLMKLRSLQIQLSSPETLRKIFTLPNTQQYLVTGPGVTDEVFALAGAHPAIKRLFIGGRTTVTEHGFSEAKRMATLESLELDRVATVSDDSVGHLVAMPKLTKILLGGLTVTDAALAHLAKMEQLKNIRLIKLPITDAGLLQLAPLKNLESLTLTGLKVTAAGVAALQQALPKCKIEWDSPMTAERFTNSLGMEFVRVPKGKSWFGGGGGKPGTQEVEFKEDFYLGKYEVTQEEWQKVMGKNPSGFSRAGTNKESVKDISDAALKRFPVEMISWEDAQSFIKRINESSKEAGWVYRLPTEAEWEYSCRGGAMADQSENAFDFYLEKGANQLLPTQANFKKHLNRTTPVGEYASNRLGLCDMHGNVWELCESLQTSKDGAVHLVSQGGCWNLDPGHERAANRLTGPPSNRYDSLGLRLARVPVGAPFPAKAPFDDKQARLHQEAWAKHFDTVVVTTNSIGMKLMLIPPGEFDMGSSAAEITKFAAAETDNGTVASIRSKGPRHRVRLTRPFQLSATEITQKQFEQINGRQAVHASYGVGGVTWDEAVEFCQKLSALPDEQQAGRSYRLPTEAEWEFACRAGSTTEFAFGSQLTEQQAMVKVASRSVGSFPANDFGLHDMHGGDWEWYADVVRSEVV